MIRNKLEEITKKYRYDFLSFLVGTFFLASAPFLSLIFYLFSLFKIFRSRNFLIFESKIDIVLPVVSVIIFSKSVYTSFLKTFNDSIRNICDQAPSTIGPFLSDTYCWDPILNWAGISNLIPLFIFFIGSRNFLISKERREITSKIFIAGTIPVFISCFAQYWFDVYGPLEIMNGLIKWFQPLRLFDNSPVSGLFSNANYTGAWLSMVFPLSIAVLYKKSKSIEYLKFYISIFLVSLFSIFIVLSQSRGALASLILTTILFFKINFRKYLFFLSTLLCLFCLIYLANNFLLSNDILTNSMNHLRDFLINKSSVTYNSSYPRLSIWNNALDFISQKPIFGWGASTFPILYKIKNDFWYSHAHNLYLDLAVSYGLIVSSLIFIFTISLIKRSYKFIFIENFSDNATDRAWWISSFIFFIAQLYDVFYFDIRINVASWIFLSGLYSIIKEKNLSK